jgi:hypothetical protein
MVVTDDGIVTDINAVQFLKTELLITAKDEGSEKLTEVKPEQPKKAYGPM